MRNSIFLLFLFIVSCNPSEKTENSAVDIISTELIESDCLIAEKVDTAELLILEPKYLNIIIDEFAINPFSNGLEKISNLRSMNYTSIDTLTINNDYVEGQVDTIFTFNFDESNIQVYSLPDKEFVINSILKQDILPIKEGISIGDLKTDVINKLSLPDSLDTNFSILRIAVLEVVQWVDLEFEQDTLTEINFQGYYD